VSDTTGARAWRVELRAPEAGRLVVALSGNWRMRDRLPEGTVILADVGQAEQPERVAFDTSRVIAWDSGLVCFVTDVLQQIQPRGIAVDPAGLPDGVRRLLRLASAVPEKRTRGAADPMPWLARLGTALLVARDETLAMATFLGEALLAFWALARGRARFRRSDLVAIVQDCGVGALPIVGLISFLVGLILAFLGAVQLRQFGAQIYVANLVGLAMLREIGAMMTAIVMAGRTGAAFAAQLGTMQVNEEIDAMITMGLSPMEFLVLPRMLALIAMMPLLTVYSDLLGIMAGALVGVTMLDVSATQYVEQLKIGVGPADFAMGLVKASVCGVLIAIAGCLRGMEAQRSAAAVGRAATSAVVTSIVLIIVAEAVLTVIFHGLGY